jgi:mono/diheme cytochrome c family protein
MTMRRAFKRFHRGHRRAFFVLGLVAASSTVSAQTAPAADLVQQGHYLADAAHCAACHSQKGGAPFAGGVPLNSPFGVMYSSNITPDRETGIGDWTEAEFAAALRKGIGKHGEYLYPSMPYLAFTKFSDADVHALWAYFRSVAPAAQKVQPNTMKFPFNVRLGIGAWQALYFKPGRYVDDPSQSAEWNRGAYLVQGAGHCAACHTPTNFALAPKLDKPLRGAVIDHWYAPDISAGPYSGIRDWSQADLVAFFKNDHNKKNVSAVGPMYDTINLGLSHLSDSDLNAIAVYLKNRVSSTDTAPPTAPALPAERHAAGKQLYGANCESCHGADGKGRYGIAPALADNTTVTAGEPTTAIRSVLEGFPPRKNWGVMPSFAYALDAQDVADVLNYARTAWGNAGPANITPSKVERLARDTGVDAPRVNAAVVCPNAPADWLDPKTIADVAALAHAPDTRSTARLVAGYHARHPAIAKGELVTTIAGAYCRDVMTATGVPYVDRQNAYVTFMGHVSEAAARLP